MSRIVVRNIWSHTSKATIIFSFHTRKNINFTKDQISLRSRVVRVKIRRKNIYNSTTKVKKPLTFNYQIALSLLLHNTVVKKKKEKDI